MRIWIKDGLFLALRGVEACLYFRRLRAIGLRLDYILALGRTVHGWLLDRLWPTLHSPLTIHHSPVTTLNQKHRRAVP